MTFGALLAITAGVLALAAIVLRLAHHGFARASVDLSEVEVLTAAGESVRIGSLVERPSILILPRYYG